MLQKLTLDSNFITSTGVGVILETMEQSSLRITHLDLEENFIGNEGGSLLARSLGNNALPNLTRLSLSQCGIGDNGFIALVSALEKNSLSLSLHLDLRSYPYFSERAYLALAESLPEIKVLQRVDFDWRPVLASAMPLLLAGLRKKTSLFRIHVVNCSLYSVPPITEHTTRCAGGWMQEMERLEYRNRFLTFIHTPDETRRPRGVWPHALARVATFPDAIFEVLRSKPSLMPSEDTDKIFEEIEAYLVSYEGRKASDNDIKSYMQCISVPLKSPGWRVLKTPHASDTETALLAKASIVGSLPHRPGPDRLNLNLLSHKPKLSMPRCNKD
jgi:hypothetical protein